MAFDMGFNFRGTAGFVSDGPEGVPVLGEAYPHTYTNGNGQSLNAGWGGVVGVNNTDRDNTNDPRIAGINWQSGGGILTFTMDLSSGSAPGAGTYTVDFAGGDAAGANLVDCRVLDNTTALIDLTNGGAGYSEAIDHYRDATLADVAATTTWTGTTVSKTWATTTAVLEMNKDAVGGAWVQAHFRLTLQGGAPASVPDVLMAPLLAV